MGWPTDLFVQPLPSYLECTVCLEGLKYPVECCTEAHCLCQGCYDQVMTSYNKACPTCRRPLSKNARPAKTLARILDGLEYADQVLCGWKPRECVARARGCLFIGNAVQMDAHKKNECPFATIFCPRGCGKTFVRSTEAGHELICTEWPCRVTDGCPTRTTKKNRDAHEKFCKEAVDRLHEYHNLLEEQVIANTANGDATALKKEVATLKREASTLKAKATRADNAAAKVRAELDALKAAAPAPAQPLVTPKASRLKVRPAAGDENDPPGPAAKKLKAEE
ncbi:hypothetical protein JCM10207_002892 [Rhodosporidiobolus poonsookiae]